MRLADLHGARVRRQDGKVEGMVWEVHCRDGRVTELGIGTGGLFGRMTGRARGRRIPWSDVVQVRGREIVIGTGSNPDRSRHARPAAD